MNKKFLIILVLICLLALVIVSFKFLKKEQSGNITEDRIELEEQIGEYTIKYNEQSFIYEVYDKYGRLIVSSSNREGCEEYVNNIDLHSEIIEE